MQVSWVYCPDFRLLFFVFHNYYPPLPLHEHLVQRIHTLPDVAPCFGQVLKQLVENFYVLQNIIESTNKINKKTDLRTLLLQICICVVVRVHSTIKRYIEDIRLQKELAMMIKTAYAPSVLVRLVIAKGISISYVVLPRPVPWFISVLRHVRTVSGM